MLPGDASIDEQQIPRVRLGKLDVFRASYGDSLERSRSNSRDKLGRFVTVKLNEIERNICGDLQDALERFIDEHADESCASVHDMRNRLSTSDVDTA